MIIRTTTAGDGEQLRALRIEALTNHPTAFSSSPEDALEYDWAERAASGHGDGVEAIFVADDGGRLVAMAGVFASARAKFPHKADIWGVYVRPEFRGRRLSEALVNAAVEWARGKGRTVVKMSVVATNGGALRCYLRCGFQIYGIDPAAIVVDGVEYDEVLLYKRLTGRGGGG